MNTQRCGAARFAHWGSLLECDLGEGHDGLHEDHRLNVQWTLMPPPPPKT